ncbi:hypothetical protein ETAE_1638 [Edwardsiella piscicida]|uniref:Uncharacterized protein n=2 Tax=Edwardsiella TaxID=635 RepID=A0A0H3DQI1_EDWTF|nr:hypothetical protein ETAE_1638 [Edwardsiella tarda EIB202]ADM41591.1 hypothetical protein ETAF_1481 [Edwardsiella tarda FL6-60]
MRAGVSVAQLSLAQLSRRRAARLFSARGVRISPFYTS